MQTKNLSLALPEHEWSVLCKDAGQELRTPKQHARFLLRRALGIAEDQEQPTSDHAKSGTTVRQDLASATL